MTNTNSIFPGPSEKIRQEIDKLCFFHNLNFVLGNVQDLQITDPCRESIQMAIRYFDGMCKNESCGHKIWIVAGGFASFHVGKTNNFNDIDIFICCNGDLRCPSTKLGTGVSCWYRNMNVVTLVHRQIRVQVIQVNFDHKLRLTYPQVFLDLFSVYVMSKFDLSICKVALCFNEETIHPIYVIDMSCIDQDRETTDIRKEKYKQRRIVNVVKCVPSLRLLAAAALFKL